MFAKWFGAGDPDPTQDGAGPRRSSSEHEDAGHGGTAALEPHRAKSAPEPPLSRAATQGAGPAADQDIGTLRREVLGHHNDAHQRILQAMALDERADHAAAKRKYEAGLDSLRKGLLVDCTGGEGREWDKARELQGKMRNNQKMFSDRVQELDEQLRNPKPAGHPSHEARGPRPANAKVPAASGKSKPPARPPAPQATALPSNSTAKQRLAHANAIALPRHPGAQPKASAVKVNHMAGVDSKLAQKVRGVGRQPAAVPAVPWGRGGVGVWLWSWWLVGA